jgi:hypothetical protein
MQLITIIFQHLSSIYLQKWTDQFSDTKMLEAAMREWAIGLRDLTPLQVKQGIDQCRVNAAWPPSISEFIRFAKAMESLHYRGNAYQKWHALPMPKGDPLLARRSMQYIRQCLL